MLKILLKSVVLFLIVLSVYLIIHPQSCANMLAGRERMAPVSGAEGTPQHPMAEPKPTITAQPVKENIDQNELFEPQTTNADALQPATATQKAPFAVYDSDCVPGSTGCPTTAKYSQEDYDYAVASRYVELEREYSQRHTIGKDTATELSYIVMDDFGMTPEEWNSFLSRATQTDLFEKARRDLPVQSSK